MGSFVFLCNMKTHH